MKTLLRILAIERLWPLWAVLGLALLLVPRLGAYGFWEPQEMAVAARALPPSPEELAAQVAAKTALAKRDKITARAQAKKLGDESPLAVKTALAALTAKREKLKSQANQRPPLPETLTKFGISALGVSEFGARLPMVLMALLAGLVTYFLGVRIRGPRAGALAVLILASSPLFVFQARQLTSEMGALAGGALMLLGGVGLAASQSSSQPSQSSSSLRRLLDCLWVAVGAALAFFSAGALIGVLAPLAAILAVASMHLLAPRHDANSGEAQGDSTSASKSRALGIIAMVSLAALAYFLTFAVFHWADAGDSDFSLFGETLRANEGYNQWIAGTWKHEGNLKMDFDSLLTQVAFGMFPWVCVAPIAVSRMAAGRVPEGTNPLGGRMLFAWIAVAWLVCTIALRKIGSVQYPAVAAIAVAIAVWIDETLAGRERADRELSRVREGPLDDTAGLDTAGLDTAGLDTENNSVARLAPPLLALFALFAAIVVARDIESFPEQFLSLHLDSRITKFPEGVHLYKMLLGLGMLFGVLLAAWLHFWHPRQAGGASRQAFPRLRKYSLFPALGVSLVVSVFLSQVWVPGLSRQLSSRATFSAFRALHEPGNLLGIMGQASDGAKFYAQAPFESLVGRSNLIAFLKKPERVFALVGASELCPLHRESTKQGFPYYVVDDSNASKIMLSNRMWNQDVPPPASLRSTMRNMLDRNPLARYIVRDKPAGIQKTLDINFDDKLQLIGIDMPEAISRGDEFTARLYYKVLKPIRRNFQVFVHFDGPSVRFQGDHWPVHKRCGTNYWEPGTYIVDEFSVEAGSKGHARGDYKIWTGLFVGSSGNWENMKALSGNPDDNNRVLVGTLRLQ